MSHTSSIKAVKITSLTALRAAVSELVQSGVKCALLDGAIPRAFFPNQPGLGKADHVLQLQGAAYDVGFYKQEDGSYEARTDFWGGSVEKILGGTATTEDRKEQAKLGKFFQAYAICATMEQARKRGQSAVKRVAPNGKVTLEITGPGI